MESDPNEQPLLTLRERFFKTWLPPVAVLGGVATLVAAALKTRPARPQPAPTPGAPAAPPGSASAATPELLQIQRTAVQPAAPTYARHYRVDAVLPRNAAAGFRQTLLSVATGADNSILALGDGDVRLYDRTFTLVRRWRAPENAECLTMASDGRVYVAGSGRVEIFSRDGARVGGFAMAFTGEPPSLTAIKVVGDTILVADASARLVRRIDATGRQLGLIGDKGPTRTFMLPNGRLDIDVDAGGTVRVTDTGRHSVTSWSIDGTPRGRFGKFGMSDPADFVGCCNPVNLATTPDGKVVTAEKMVARVKVFDPDGTLLGVIGTEHFDPMCTQIHLAVDSTGRIVTADPVRCQIQTFALEAGDRRVPAPASAEVSR